tara:strand:+ start:2241 stop:2567 length:327 start_codon:yes stop_codon:yes gene_type:complete
MPDKKQKKSIPKLKIKEPTLKEDTLWAGEGGFTDWGMTGVGSGEFGNKPGKYLHEGHPDFQGVVGDAYQQDFGEIQIDPKSGRHFATTTPSPFTGSTSQGSKRNPKNK